MDNDFPIYFYPQTKGLGAQYFFFIVCIGSLDQDLHIKYLKGGRYVVAYKINNNSGQSLSDGKNQSLSAKV